MISPVYRDGMKNETAIEEEGWFCSIAGCPNPVGFEQKVFHGTRARIWIEGFRPETLQFWEGKVDLLGSE